MNPLQNALSSGADLAEAAKSTVRDLMIRIGGIALLVLMGLLCLALMSWTVTDPSFNHATGAPVQNILGFAGSAIADMLIQVLGLATILLPLPVMLWALKIVRQKRLENPSRKSLALIGAIAVATLFFACLPAPATWPLPTGLGGILGDGLHAVPFFAIPDSLAAFAEFVVGAIALAGTLFLLKLSASWPALGQASDEAAQTDEDKPVTRNIGVAAIEPAVLDDDLGDEPSEGLLSRMMPMLGAASHTARSLLVRFRRLTDRSGHHGGSDHPFGQTHEPGRLDPHFADGTAFHHPLPEEEEAGREYDDDYSAYEEVDPVVSEFAPKSVQPSPEPQVMMPAPSSVPAAPVESRVQPSKARLKQGQRVSAEAQPSLLGAPEFEFPPLRLLAEAPAHSANEISAEALDQNARLLETVLEDFGVRGEIINVRPGPVVTLYELEPAPGTKSSRVIGLADDIARSMSAVSARVAVVSGRNAIGIELPNSNRDTVYLRELLASVDFEKNKSKLPLCLGKTIGGEPVIADLARMPHLLIAGTTGSGKSVAINTMILSILYRLSPEDCKMIMVDPKMLELSVYDGIPHLLSPVVTDPRKAVVALKWTVREMEDRYKKMSKVGVRNIDGYNQKVAQSGEGETFSRQVQTGFDAETGQPIFETEEVALERMPFIVVIIDEMADLMMVAGKEIEGAVQRLAQMARAAGIHVVMATQRPSVDVITGTIKANFPTRISFQVTSKIDSRTILGEQGAEQLLGQGDMLYMMGGGRITRVHGPFVSDDEVEEIVAHLKSQGAPEYLEAITEEPEEGSYEIPGMETSGGNSSGNELYDQAVAIVLRDRKASTSYVQRRLSIGYNRAATLIEKMEEEGVISRPNSKGHREILVGEDPAV